MYFRLGLQCHCAEDARQAEHILRFEERAVAVTIHFHCHDVLAFRIDEACDVERCRVARVLRESHIPAVHIEIEEGVGAVEINEHFLPAPVGRYGECAAIGTHLVAVFIGHPVCRRFAHHAAFPVAHTHLMLENNALVGIDWHAVLL